MRARGVLADLAFIAVLAVSVAVPLAGDTPQAQSGGGSGGSGGGTGGGTNTGSGRSGGSGSGSNGGTGGPTTPGGGQPSRSGQPGTTQSPRAGGGTNNGGSGTAGAPAGQSGGSTYDGAAPESFGRAIPEVGTAIEATIRNLPPFLLLSCLVGLVAGADSIPPSSQGPDAATDVAAACAKVDVDPLQGWSGPFSPGIGDVDPDDIRLHITIEPGGRIHVHPYLPDYRRNRLLLTLLAALLLVLLVGAVAYTIGRGRRRPPPPAPPWPPQPQGWPTTGWPT